MTNSSSFKQCFAPLFDQINQHAVSKCIILTPNKRLSRFLHSQYNRYQTEHHSLNLDAQKNAWTSLNCHSFHGWIQQQWDGLATQGEHPLSAHTPLTTFQESTLWESIINDHPETPPLLAIQATVKLAQSAWRLMHEWHLDLNEFTDSNTLLFLAWCRAFQQQCDEKYLLSPVQQVNAIIEALHDHLINAPKQVYLYGFDELTPQMDALLNAFSNLSAQIEHFELPASNCEQSRYELPSEDYEIEASALWAKNKVEQLLAVTKQELTPLDNIAIVVPNLAQHRERIERIFNQVFEPQALLPDSPQHAPGYNMSAATPLNQVPMVNIALQVLSCNQKWIDVETASQLLRSPFVGIMSEMDERALVDLSIRGHEFDISLKQLKAALGKPYSSEQQDRKKTIACPDFYQRVSEFETLSKRQLTTKAYPSQWIPLFNEQLSAFGWPGNRPLDTMEYQQFQIWQDTLTQFAGLDHITEKVSLTDGTKHLRRLVAQASFKAQTKDSPIQILGVLEAAGLPFNAIWFMNLDDETWPPAPNPNPLIPVSLQVQMQLPQSAPNRELVYAKRLTQRFVNSTQEIVFSHAASKAGQQLLPSPLIEQAERRSFELAKESTYADTLSENTLIETSWDHCGPHVKNNQDIRGGSQLLKDQAACPFRAFAKHRLHSESIPTITIGLDASERGNVLHNALELIWKKLRSQEKLLNMEPEVLDSLILNAIDEAMAGVKSKRFIGERFLQIESERLTQQIHQWLNLEKQRTPFTVVLNEGKRTVKLGQLPIKIRYDRVDKLEDGSLFVLDYKTGNQVISRWNSERPDEPQVPLYCIANQDKVSGAAFGQINAQEVALKGVAADTTVAPGLHPIEKITVTNNTDNWDTAVKQWREVLEKLANEFMAGAAEVDPKKLPQTCNFCELAALCRIKDQFDSQAMGDNEPSEGAVNE